MCFYCGLGLLSYGLLLVGYCFIIAVLLVISLLLVFSCVSALVVNICSLLAAVSVVCFGFWDIAIICWFVSDGW